MPFMASRWQWRPTVAVAILAIAAAAAPPFSCDPASPVTAAYAFCNKSLAVPRRADALVAMLTLQEKISQLGDEAPAVARLGIPSYKWWSEALHGVANAGKGIHLDGPAIRGATSFPQVILTAAAFDVELWHRVGEVIGTEARAVYNAGQAEGLTFWAPNINIFRDPRWGRGQETPGEDPATASKYAAAFVRGVQGDPLAGGRARRRRGLKASACCKHFTAYDLENWNGTTRFVFDAVVTAQDLADTFQPPFRSCVEDGRASGIMCSYNRVNGVPPCASHELLTATARSRWRFDGYITSDCDAVAIIHDAQGYAKSAEDAVADVLKAGMDVNCGGYVQSYAASALQQGKITEHDIDRALRNLFAVRIRLGFFDGDPRKDKFGSIGAGEACKREHQDLALQAARDGIVLLKNDNGLLPLAKPQISSLAVVGPNANNATLLLGNYYGVPCAAVTPLQVLQGYVKDTRYFAGCSSAACAASSVDGAVQLARSADQVVLFMGLDQDQEREGLDRVDLVLPGMQPDLIARVADAARKPVVLVLLCGGPVDVGFAAAHPKIGAILWAGYPGEAGGSAIAQVLFGEHNPGGRLPVTWYPQEFAAAVRMTDMRMRADAATGYPGRTYRFYNGRTVYKFGYGLSYSRYSHSFVSATTPARRLVINSTAGVQSRGVAAARFFNVGEIGRSGCRSLEFPVAVKVKNEGGMDGKHPVLLFLRWPAGAAGGRPVRQLVGFKTVLVKAGETALVEFAVRPCEHLARTTEAGKKVVDAGSHFLTVGDADAGSEEQLEIIVAA